MNDRFTKFEYNHLLFIFPLHLSVQPSIVSLRTLVVLGM
jgi:hypothetical protein